MGEKSLHELLPEWVGADDPRAAVRVSAVTDDSRRVEPGALFVAIAGLTVDGHEHAASALERGAAALLLTRQVAGLPEGAVTVVVDDTKRALGLAAARFFDEPSRTLSLIGVTGTNGKTTTAALIEAMMVADGKLCGVVGTVGHRYAGREEPARYTTPTPVALQALLARIRDAGCSHAALEVSSHALEMGRVWGCGFDVAAFSQLTQDHLDLHGSMQAYAAAKQLLFSRYLRGGGTAVINADGAYAEVMLEAARARGDVAVVRCTRRAADDSHSDSGGGGGGGGGQGDGAGEAVARLVDLSADIDGLRGELVLQDGERVALTSPQLGDFNADNILLAAACARAAGASAEAIAAGAQRANVAGRLERVDSGDGSQPAVLVDYAHTPDALARAIAVLRPLCRGRLLTVFGCGGDRDRQKRPLMGRAARASDVAYVTSDNPRSEAPEAIIDDILPAFADAPDDSFVVEPDRRAAITRAVADAGAGDVVLVAGKGHEDYQILGERRIHFDDREVAREALAATGEST